MTRSALNAPFRAAAAIAFLLQMVPPGSVHADKGRWTQPENWSGTSDYAATHLALLRGDGAPDHSRILYWYTSKGGTTGTFYGQERGWSPGNDDCSSATGTGFTFRGAQPAPFDVFCAGHVQLADSRRLMVNAGTLPYGRDLGERRSAIFTAGTGYGVGSWDETGALSDGRWYPTSVTLVDGRILTLSGDRYPHLRAFGGARGGTLPGAADAEGDSVLRFGVDEGGRWDPSVLPAADNGQRPAHRQRLTSVDMEKVSGFGGQVFFGGLGENDPLDEGWILSRSDGPVQDADYSYQWKLVLPTPRPQPRSDHAAVVRDNEMVLFGGRNQNGTARSDVWRLHKENNVFKWSTITTNSTPPRYGHAAVYDTFTAIVDGTGTFMKRMLVFGGIGADEGSLVDGSKVYELRFNLNDPTEATWHVHTPAALGADGVPSDRYWHSLTMDRTRVAEYATNQSGHVAVMFGGKLASGSSAELWELWIFRDGTMGWKKRTYTGSEPSARHLHAAAYLGEGGPGTERLYIHGGVLGAGGGNAAATYMIQPRAASPAWQQFTSSEASYSGHAVSFEGSAVMSRVAEVYDSLSGQWFTDAGATLSQHTYPVTFLVPGRTVEGGRVYSMGKDNAMYYVDVRPQGTASSDWQKLETVDFTPTTGVMYEPGKIMVAGRDGTVGKTRTLNTSSLTNPWQSQGNMLPRDKHNLVILPGGKVLVVGGMYGSTAMFRPQLWDPATGNWTDTLDSNPNRLAKQQIVRNYHSTAMLLPDGRVLSAGGDGSTSPDRHKVEIFCPPYLLNTDGSAATRPVIGDVVQRVRYGYDFSIFMTSGKTLSSVSLIRPAATTHSFDQNQRYVPLTIRSYSVDSSRITVASPADSSIAPAGDYLLFLVDGKGVPSIARWLRVGAVWIAGDVTPPATAEDLVAEAISHNSIYWTWTVPGDDATSGQAWQHKFVYSTSPITSTSFASASPVPNLPLEYAGNQQSYIRDGLSPCTWHYTAIRAVDESGNYSGIAYASGARTLCGGGGGGLAAVRSREGDRRSPTSSSLKGEVEHTSFLPDPGRGLLVANYEAGANGVTWTIHRADAAAVMGSASADPAKITFQESAGGGWRSRAALEELPVEIGVRSRLRSGRVVLPATYDLRSIQAHPPGFDLTAARHSRLGDVGVEDLAAGAALTLAAGDTMSLTFVPTTAETNQDQDCFFVLSRPALESASAERAGRTTVSAQPGVFALRQNQPNPFATVTRIDFSLPSASRARLQILDPMGRRVRVLANGSFEAGEHHASWDRRTEGGALAKPGVYFYELETGTMRERRKLIVLP